MINSKRPGLIRRMINGAGAGAGATAIMTGVFAAFEAADWLGQLPPRQIVDRVLSPPDDRRAEVITRAAHFGYGAALGSAYTALSKSPSAVGGAAYGIAVCALSYEVAMPLLGIRTPLHRDGPREIAALTAAHLAYGLALGWQAKRQPGSVRRFRARLRDSRGQEFGSVSRVNNLRWQQQRSAS